jgi:hypothetical protein
MIDRYRGSYLREFSVMAVGLSQLNTQVLENQTHIPALPRQAHETHQHLHSSERENMQGQFVSTTESFIYTLSQE